MDNPEQLKRVQGWNAEQFREYIDGQHPEDYQLIDVRQRYEYGEEHLVGALSLPVDDLPQQIGKLDRQKPVLIYCNQGALSQAAATVLVRAGFEHVCYLDRGFNVLKNRISSGTPEDVCSVLLEIESAVEQAELAWQMEESARLFYLEMSKTIENPEIAALFSELVVAEEQHKTTLKALWEALAGHTAGTDFAEVTSSEKRIMEGGVSLAEALAWAKDCSPGQILDYAMAMELNAYDQYLFLQRNFANPDSQRLFEVMADEERHHLKALAASLEKISRRS